VWMMTYDFSNEHAKRNTCVTHHHTTTPPAPRLHAWFLLPAPAPAPAPDIPCTAAANTNFFHPCCCLASHAGASLMRRRLTCMITATR
jgi:hypothetical protein